MTRAIAFVIVSAFTLGTVLFSRIEPGVEVHSGPAPSRDLAEATTTSSAVTTTAIPTAAKRSRSTAPYPSDELLWELALCESNGDQQAVSSSGKYLSFFQWEIGTWWSVGGEGDPRDHPYEVQRDLARTLILQAGWSQFPTCSYRIGAR